MNDNQDIKDLDINEIFNEVLNIYPLKPNSYPLEFDVNSLKELFEFLLQFTTMLSKHFFSNDSGIVDLSKLSQNDFAKINSYMMCIGFICNFQALTANNYNLNYAYINRYDKINITSQTKLKDLIFGLKCEQKLYIISFDFLPTSLNDV
jgi:hypothetical protein